MLRDLYAYGTEELKDVLGKFKLNDSRLIDITKFQMLTPDSFIWRLRMTNGVYYLYAEDFIESLEHVKRSIQEVAGPHPGKFIEAIEQKEFEELEPVLNSEVYAEPDEYNEQIMKFAVDSGHDLVFLYKIMEPNEQS